jgi:flagellar motor switch protein FliG
MATLEEQVTELTERLEKLEKHLGMAPLRPPLADFKGMMEGLDFRTLEWIFRGESDRELAIAFMGQEKDVLENVRKALSKSRWKRVYAEMRNLTEEGVTEGWVKGSQEELQRKIQKLEEMGEIVVAGSGRQLVGSTWPFPEPPKLDLREWKSKVLEAVAV